MNIYYKYNQLDVVIINKSHWKAKVVETLLLSVSIFYESWSHVCVICDLSSLEKRHLVIQCKYDRST